MVDSIRNKKCPTCGNEFSYRVGKGFDRKHCSSKCRNIHKMNLKKIRFDNFPECKTKDCQNKANRVSYGLCENCYYRLRRTGSTDKPVYNYRYQVSNGYVRLLRLNHPMSDKKGNVYEHRYKMYNFYKGEPQECYWCGVKVDWDKAVIDHLNEIKSDNKIENLLYSCNNCNRARGAMLPFIKRMRNDAFKVFIKELKNQRK